jgi:4-carboxymuconolactone decarboxylase
MARLPYPDVENLDATTRQILGLAPDLNIFRMLGSCETLVAPFLALGSAILTQTKIDPQLRELAIVRAAVHCGSAYELNQHDEIAREVGVSDAKISALREGPTSDVFDHRERAVLNFTDELVDSVKVSRERFDQVAEFLDPCEIQELIIAIGYYSIVGRYLETVEVDLEKESERQFVRVSDVRSKLSQT